MSSDTVHVTGLSKDATEDTVREIFAQNGTVKSLKILPPREDKTDAAAIITMDNAEQAQWLIDNVNGTAPAGSAIPLVVKKKITNNWNKGYGKGDGGMDAWAYQQMMQYYGMGAFGMKGYGKGWGKGGGWGGKGGGGGLSTFAPEKKVWIGGLPEEGVTFRDLQAHFPGSKFATVMKGKGAGTGGVAFGTAEEAAEAIKTLNGSVLAGATLVVDVWTKKEKVETTEESL